LFHRYYFVLHLHSTIACGAGFYSDILPILQQRCQNCHRPGEIGPMPLTNYREVRPWAAAIREAVKLRKMPPWFADPRYGEFANDPRLNPDQIATIEAWVKAGAPEGPKPASHTRTKSPANVKPDMVIVADKPIEIPANSVIDYQYLIFPLHFSSDKWVRFVEVRPSDRSVVHHAVLYVRSPQSKWLRDVPPGVPYSPPRNNPEAVRRTRDTTEDVLAIYTPGTIPANFPEGMAKKIPAGADLVLQLHYTSKKTDAADRPSIALTFTSTAPEKQLLTLQMGRDDLRIPPGEPNYRASVSGTLPREALLVSLFPHMHLRGSAFEFDIAERAGHVETLLRVKPYDFYWQLNYVLKTPRLLPKGTVLRWTGYFDNSPNNPRNPDPTAEVTWGEQSWEEMMIGFFDVAVAPDLTKRDFFVR
jgi:hypothetical protein